MIPDNKVKDTETKWENHLRILLDREGTNKNEYYMMRIGKHWFGFEESARMMICNALADRFFTVTLTGGRRVLIAVMSRNALVREANGEWVYPTDEITLEHDGTYDGLPEFQQKIGYDPEDEEYIRLLVEHLSKTEINSN